MKKVLLILLVPLATGCTPERSADAPRTLEAQFQAGIQGNMSCPQLYQIRNKLKRGKPEAYQQRLNKQLIGVGCNHSEAQRPAKPPVQKKLTAEVIEETPLGRGATQTGATRRLDAPKPLEAVHDLFNTLGMPIANIDRKFDDGIWVIKTKTGREIILGWGYNGALCLVTDGDTLQVVWNNWSSADCK